MIKPIEFPEQTTTYAENQPEYQPLPVHRTPTGECISCWAGSFADRLKFLFTNKLWMRQLTFNTPLQPILPTLVYPFEPLKPTADDAEAQKRYDIDHKTIGTP